MAESHGCAEPHHLDGYWTRWVRSWLDSYGSRDGLLEEATKQSITGITEIFLVRDAVSPRPSCETDLGVKTLLLNRPKFHRSASQNTRVI